MSDKNQQSGRLFYAIIIACIISFLIAIYNSSYLTIFSNDNGGDSDYFTGYYEADPSFLELSNLKNMSFMVKKEGENNACDEYSGKLMWVEDENDIQEIDVTLDIKKINNINLYKKECDICIQSDVDHPLTNCDITCIINIKTGEIGMFNSDKSILLASFIKDNAISLYLNK